MTLKQSLMHQLRARGADITVFRKRIDDYVWFAGQLDEMKKDIKTRGRTYTSISSTGKGYEKDNPSVQNALRYSAEMNKILQSMGLNVNNVASETDEGDEDL